MRKLRAMLCAAVILGVLASLSSLGAAQADSQADSKKREAQAELAPFTLDVPSSTVRAEIEFVDTGSALRFNGEANGLDPTKRYVSLIYDNGSVPTGPDACEPTATGRPQLSGAQMFLGQWTVNKEGEGRLGGENTGAAYTPVGTFRTVSVRVFAGGPRPVRVACGLVVDEDQD